MPQAVTPSCARARRASPPWIASISSIVATPAMRISLPRRAPGGPIVSTTRRSGGNHRRITPAGLPSGRAFETCRLQEIEQVADRAAELGRMAHCALAVHGVLVPPPDATPLEKPSLHEVRDDSLNGALGDPDLAGNVSEAHAWVAGDAEQNLHVVREERPAG